MNNKLKLIGLAGRKRSGKTSLAKYLQEDENAIIITIANYLKYLCCDLLNMSYEELNEKKDNGYTFDVVPNERWYNIIDKKTHIGVENIKRELENKHINSIRQLLQVVGTDVIRKYDEKWHVRKMIEEIESYNNSKLIVVDDVRFPNEKQTILNASGEVFFIIRPNHMSVSNHASETALKWQDFDDKHIIINDRKSVDDFILQFKIHYNNNFDLYTPNSIFLYENQNYLKDANILYGYKEGGDLLNDIIRQISDDDFFYKTGIIRYKTSIKEFSKEYIKQIDKTIKHLDNRFNEFVTYNPLITENLKFFLK